MIKLPSFLRKLLGTQGELPAKKVNMPLFVTGCMRSGTTFLVDKLTTHPQLLKIGDELNQVWTDIGGAEIMGSCKHKSAAHSDPYYTYQMANYFLNFIHESKSIKRQLMRLNFYLKTKRGRITYDWDHIIPVNKSTHLVNKVGYLNASFPNSKVILIVRDIYAHSSSMKVHFDNNFKNNDIINYQSKDRLDCWSSVKKSNNDMKLEGLPSYPPNFGLIPQMWISLNLQALLEVKRIGKENCLVVSYEDLLANQNEKLSKIFSFIDLESTHKEAERKISKDHLSHQNTTTDGNSLDKWKTYLTTEEIEMIESIVLKNQEDYNQVIALLDEMKV